MNGALQFIFPLLALVTLGGALGVATSRTIFTSALFLIVSFIGVAGLFLTLSAEFLAGVQVLIYIGAIAVLILFAVMLTRQMMEGKERQVKKQWGIFGRFDTWIVEKVLGGEQQVNQQWAVAAGITGLLFIFLAWLTGTAEWRLSNAAPPADTIAELGKAFVGPYVFPFEIASIILLVALIGAIVIARE
jgi:NADH:ubiquinone oxidoreductase subunit 6 (subunit J)